MTRFAVFLVARYRRRRQIHRLVNWLVGVWRMLTPGTERRPCPLAGRCSGTGLAEFKAHGLRAAPGVLRRMHLCAPPRRRTRQRLIDAAWLVIRKPRSRAEWLVQLRVARWFLSWLDWAHLQANEWVIQLEDLPHEGERP